jgi:hypothetical protein
MNKINLLFVFLLISAMSFGQVLTGPSFMASGSIDYSETPFEQPTYTALKAPGNWTPIVSVADFDKTWDLLGEPNLIKNKTGHNDYAGTDFFDLDGAETFGTSWKAVHKDNRLYLLIKLIDKEKRVGANGDFVIELMSQPLNSLRRESADSPIRWEPTFAAGTDTRSKNYAYLRYYELGGYKLEAIHENGKVSPKGVFGLYGKTATPEWENVTEVIEIYEDQYEFSFWNKAGDGTQRVVIAMDFAKALSYPASPDNIGPAHPKVAFQEGDVVILDIKTNAYLGDMTSANRLEHFWAADRNNGYSHIYYNGLVTVSSEIISTVNVQYIDRINQQPKAYVYNGMLHVRGSDAVNLEVYNVLGAKVKAADNVRELSLHDLKKGIYFVRINNERAIKVIR